MAKKKPKPEMSDEDVARIEEECWNAAILHPDAQTRQMNFAWHLVYLQEMQRRQHFAKQV